MLPRQPSTATLKRGSIPPAPAEGTMPSVGVKNALLAAQGANRRRSSLWTTSMRRMSLAPSKTKTEEPTMKLEPTYRLQPHQNRKFSVAQVRAEIQSCFRLHLDAEQYDSRKCSKLTINLANAIKDRIKDLEFDRYKVVVQVVLGQASDQGFETASRCIWEPSQDNVATETFEHCSIFAVAMVFGIYFD